MSKYETNMVLSSDGPGVIVVRDKVTGDVSMINGDHRYFDRIAQALAAKEDADAFIDGTYEPPASKIENLSARVSVVDDVIHFDGEPVHSAVADAILRYRIEERDPTGIVRFMERLSTNPSENSRAQLFNWTQAQDLTIDRDGYIVSYKGVTARTNERDHTDANGKVLFPLDRYPFQSSSSGHGIVDGIEVTGHLPMGVGVTVEMPRAEVNDDPNQGCSTGLHVGTYDYAKGYAHAGALLEVRFDPADVVSVPADCGFAKLRCCRYEGAALHEVDYDDLSAHEADPVWDEDEAWDEFALNTNVPKGFIAAWRERRKARKSKGGES